MNRVIILPKLLLTGSSSLVGSHFVEHYAKKYEISAIGRRNIFSESNLISSFETLELQDERELKRVIKQSDAKVVINYAAETNVDGCESEKGDKNGHVYRVNTQAVSSIAEACRDSGKKLYHISTDFVFDGSRGPYSENDETGPVNTEIGWYGYTKYLAEMELAKILPQDDFCIIRISYPYRARFELKTDFARNIIKLYREGKLFPLFSDQIFSPTLIDDVSGATDFLIQNNAKGIYHVACKNPTTPYDFASKLVSTFFSVKEPESAIKKSSITEFNKTAKAPRPVKGGLLTEKIQSEGFVLKTYEQGMEEIFRQIQSEPHG